MRWRLPTHYTHRYDGKRTATEPLEKLRKKSAPSNEDADQCFDANVSTGLGLLLLAALEHNDTGSDANNGHNRNSTDDDHGVVARLG